MSDPADALAEFADRQRSRAEVARAIGISRVHLWMLATRRRRPSLRVALAIERIAGIPATRWIEAT